MVARRISTVDCKKVAENAVKNWFSYQDPFELEIAARWVQKFDPRVILEIGTANNASIATWVAVSNPDLVIGIDPLTNPQTPDEKKSFNKLVDEYKINIIPTIDRKAHSELEAILDGRKVDFLFIDGGHDYHDASYDYQAFAKYLNVPALIGFHDVFQNPVLCDGGSLVGYFWERMVIESEYNYRIINNNTSMGIGMISLNENNKKSLLKPEYLKRGE